LQYCPELNERDSFWDEDIYSTEIMDLFILSSSKGLAKTTKSKNLTVQIHSFIHESVREFLLKENGLGQVWADIQVNSIGLSQDRLKECCSNYMRSNISSILETYGPPLVSSSQAKATKLRKNALLEFTFLNYAVRNIFNHAELAHANGVSQEYFVKEFELGNWVQLNNIIERYQIRRHPPNIDLLYILAENNCAKLIDISLREQPCTYGENGRYGNPIFAAFANDNRDAFEALARSDCETHPHGCKFPYPTNEICYALTKIGNP
jgi:hypothetical protein